MSGYETLVNNQTSSSSISEEEKLASYRSCPTCQGVGRLKKETAEGYIALIPADDYRLKPRRTIIKIICACVATALLCALLIFFFYTRQIDITLDPSTLIPDKVEASGQEDVLIAANAAFNLTNYNFVDITLTHVLLYVSRMNKQQTFSFDKNTNIMLRSRSVIDVPINFTLFHFRFLCKYNEEYFSDVYIKFEYIVKAIVLGQNVEASARHFRVVNCYFNSTASGALGS